MGFDVQTGKGEIRPVINVTPLVDVVLVLLIIFMVVAPMLTKQFTVQVPDQEKKEVQPDEQNDDQIVMKLEANGRMTINSKDVAMEELGARLAPMLNAKAPDDRIVFFDAAEDAPYGTAVLAMDIARGAGARTVGIVPEALGPPLPTP